MNKPFSWVKGIKASDTVSLNDERKITNKYAESKTS
jgi:hypothetical protein